MGLCRRNGVRQLLHLVLSPIYEVWACIDGQVLTGSNKVHTLFSEPDVDDIDLYFGFL